MTSTNDTPSFEVNISRWAMGALLYSTIPTISCLLWGINRKLAQRADEDERNGNIVKPKKDNRTKAEKDADEREKLIN